MPAQRDPFDQDFLKYGHGNEEVPAIEGYQIHPDSIVVKFHQPSRTGYTTYLYTNEVTGKEHIDKMKELAEKSTGLLAYINEHVRKAYAQRW